jgi:hypothetical protein
MKSQFADVMVHLNETMDEAGLSQLEEEMRGTSGVMAISHDGRHPHLLKVEYDAEILRPTELLRPIQQRGLHAQLVGM